MRDKFEKLFEKAAKRGSMRFAISGAASDEVLLSVHKARKMGLMDPILIGPAGRIRGIAKRLKIRLDGIQIFDHSDETEIANRTAFLAGSGQAVAIMKGHISTPVLLKAVLDPQYGLRTGGLLSHIAYMDVPSFPKMFVVTDSGMVIRPTLEQKIVILQNAISFVRRLGVRKPKVAILAANEKVSPHMQETLDAVELVRLNQTGRFGNVYLEGPLALDMALSKESAKIKGVKSRVAGRPDILMVPDIASGNIFAKGMVYLAKAKISGLIVGAKVPIVLISRAEKADTLLRSIALACVVSE
jgi:phosphate butyryltransferase